MLFNTIFFAILYFPIKAIYYFECRL